MSDDPCRRWREMLGAYALGQLTPEERDEVRRHLEICPGCNDALDEVLPVARLLPVADPERVLHRPITPPRLAAQLFEKIAEEKRKQRRRRYVSTSVVGIAAAVLLGFLVVPTVRTPSIPGDSVTFAQAPEQVIANARLVNQPWGTEIHLNVEGLTGRQTVWFERPDGTRGSAGSFDAQGQESVQLVLSTAFRPTDAVALCVSPPDKAPVLRAPLAA